MRASAKSSIRAQPPHARTAIAEVLIAGNHRLRHGAESAPVVRVPHYVYILRCADGSLYIGRTSDLDSRLARHNEGRGCLFTAARRPLHLAYYETFAQQAAGQTRERQLKRWTRAKKEALIAGNTARLKKL